VFPDHLGKFRPEEFSVFETAHWIVAVRGKQVTIGSCVILLKRNVDSVSSVSPEEAAGFVEAVKWFEGRTGELFAPDRFNYVAAMMKDRFVHFHAFPRYEAPRVWNDKTWVDEAWPAVIAFNDVETSDDDLRLLRAALRH
jgi:diadenosine tetraphosphate (Ap4A) HIT family hydrolase